MVEFFSFYLTVGNFEKSLNFSPQDRNRKSSGELTAKPTDKRLEGWRDLTAERESESTN